MVVCWVVRVVLGVVDGCLFDAVVEYVLVGGRVRGPGDGRLCVDLVDNGGDLFLGRCGAGWIVGSSSGVGGLLGFGGMSEVKHGREVVGVAGEGVGPVGVVVVVVGVAVGDRQYDVVDGVVVAVVGDVGVEGLVWFVGGVGEGEGEVEVVGLEQV